LYGIWVSMKLTNRKRRHPSSSRVSISCGSFDRIVVDFSGHGPRTSSKLSKPWASPVLSATRGFADSPSVQKPSRDRISARVSNSSPSLILPHCARCWDGGRPVKSDAWLGIVHGAGALTSAKRTKSCTSL
jgi:hypothetical protein